MQQLINLLKFLTVEQRQAIYNNAVELSVATGDGWYSDFIDAYLDEFDEFDPAPIGAYFTLLFLPVADDDYLLWGDDDE